jgi:hypothetical protein
MLVGLSLMPAHTIGSAAAEMGAAPSAMAPVVIVVPAKIARTSLFTFPP